MAADLAKFSAAIDKVHKAFVSAEVPLDQAEAKGLGSHGTKKHLEKYFQQQLQRARAAFLQEFRNHSVVVETEIGKLREQLTKRFEEQYGDRIAQLKLEKEAAGVALQKCTEEIAKLKGMAQAHEAYIDEVRPRLEVEDKLRSELGRLKEELDAASKGGADSASQLRRREELVAHLTREVKRLEALLAGQATALEEQRLKQEEHTRALQQDMAKQREQFQANLTSYEQTFEEYKAKSRAQLQLVEILSNRRAEALEQLEQERQRHIKARTKPSARIGMPPPGTGEATATPRALAAATRDLELEGLEAEAVCQGYELPLDTRYRVDDMGMDTSWRDYNLGDPLLTPMLPRGQGATQARSQVPRFRVERIRKGVDRVTLAPMPPVTRASEVLRPPRLHVQEMSLASSLSGPPVPHSAR